MSRRFGRNQKRRMRAEVAAAQAETILHAQVARDNAEQRDRARDEVTGLRDYLGDIALRVGKYAITAGVPQNFDADWLGRGIGSFRMQVPMAMPTRAHYGAAMPETIMVYDETMRLLEVDAVRAPMSRDMHCRVSFDHHEVGYAISDHALHRMTQQEIERRIAPEIARLLAIEIKRWKR